MLISVLLAVSLVVLTLLFHYFVLRWLSSGLAQIEIAASIRMLLIVLVALVAHLVEVGLYAVVFRLGDGPLNLGHFGGTSVDGPLDYYYFSIVSYTSLGLGDIYPQGHLRFITGVEALNGLLLITWSGSFIYLAMTHLWPWRACASPTRTAKT